MKRKIFGGTFIALAMLACTETSEPAVEELTEEQKQEVVEMETTTEEVENGTVEMEETVNQLESEIDSLLNDI
ncbi:MAG: hypothetical protein ACWA41_08445 [Putridiphycobacter sp.]